MSIYMKLGEVPRKRHTRLARDADKSFLREGLAYEHVVTTAGFDRAYSIMYHLRPPTRVKKVELVGHFPLEAASDQPLRHRHLKSQDLPRAGDPIRDLLLDGEQVVDPAVIGCRPQVATIGDADKLRRHAQLVVRPPHTALDNQSDLEPLADFPDLEVFGFQ